MEIILLKPYRKLGKIGNTCVVANGFARNYLIPNGVALRATDRNKKLFEERKHDLERINLNELQNAQALSEKIQGAKFTFIRPASEDGKLFGSITQKEVAASINNMFKIDLKRNQVVLDQPIKAIGVAVVHISLHHDVIVDILVNVARSDAEALVAFKAHENEITKNLTSSSTAEDDVISQAAA